MQDMMLIGLVIKKHNYIQVRGVIPCSGICGKAMLTGCKCISRLIPSNYIRGKIRYTDNLTTTVLFISKRCGCKCKMLLFTGVAKFQVY